ncbi:MAG: alpha/beta hydrolase [Flavobacteriaceae bacterium]
MSTTTEESVRLAALDGHALGGIWFQPSQAPRAAAIVNGAVGAKQRIYAPLARSLAGLGIATLTYDYRGIGASRPQSLRGFRTDLRDWTISDAGGAIAAVRARHPDIPLLGVGHSLGGQLLGLQREPDAFSRYVAVATLSGYWRNLDDSWRAFIRMNLVGAPLAMALGHVPGFLGLGEDLPAGVFLQWARWCRQPDYLFDAPEMPEKANFARYTGPYLAIGATDDPWGNPRALRALLKHYDNATVEEAWLEPARSPNGRIGHFGFFRPENREALWPVLTDWLTRDL